LCASRFAGILREPQANPMISLEEKIARMQRLLQRMEEDQPYLHVRLSALGDEHRQSARNYAERMRAEAEAELQRLIAECGDDYDWASPQPAD
jgi:hypothetical protein